MLHQGSWFRHRCGALRDVSVDSSCRKDRLPIDQGDFLLDLKLDSFLVAGLKRWNVEGVIGGT